MLINLLFFSTNGSYAKTYQVENVEIIEPYDLEFKKDQVIDGAFKKAFNLLLSRILKSGDLSNVNIAKLSQIKLMIESFSITNERFYNNNYYAIFNVEFEKKKILKYLDKQGIVSSNPAKSKILFIPIMLDLDKNELLTYNENLININWNNDTKNSYLLEYIIPTEDIEDYKLISSNLINIENYDFKDILKKYDYNNNIVAIIFKESNKLKILSKIKFKNKEIFIQNEFSNLNLNIEKSEIEVIKFLKTKYEDQWKLVNQINTSIKLPISISIDSKDLDKINYFENELNKYDLIYDYYIDHITNSYTVYRITYNNTPNNFISYFKSKNFDIDVSGKVWVIK